MKINIQNLKKHLPLIFTIASAGGVVLTAIQAVKDSKKASMKMNSINDYSISLEDWEKQKKKAMLTSYIPTFMIGGTTIALMFVSNHLGKKQYLALASAAALATENYRNYRQEVVKRYGEPVDIDIIKTIACEKAENAHITGGMFFGSTSLELEGIHEQEVTFYDSYGQRFFKSTLGNVLQAEYYINRDFALGKLVSLQDFYIFLGLDPEVGSEKVGWGINIWEDGINWIEFNHVKAYDEKNDLSYYIIDFPFPPSPDFEEYE